MFVDPNIPVEGEHSLKRFIHSVCYFGDKSYKVHYVHREKGTTYLVESNKKQDWLILALKVLACATLIIPAIVWIHHKCSNSKYRLYQQPIQEFSVHDLPSDALKHVFSFLDFQEQVTPSQVDKLWNQKLLEESKSEQIQLVDNLIRSLSSELQPEVLKECTSAVNKFRKQKCEHLKEIKKSLIDLKLDLAVILYGKINKDTFFKIQPLPQFFENVYDLSISHELLVEKLIQRKSWDQIAYIAENLKSNFQKTDVYRDLIYALMEVEEYDRIVEIIVKRASALNLVDISHVVEVFLNGEDFDRALIVAEVAKQQTMLYSLEANIDEKILSKVRSLLYQKQYDAAFNLAGKVNDKYKKDELCQDIINVLLVREHIDEAIQFVNNLKDESIQSDGFLNICKALCHRAEFEKASLFAHRITNFQKSWAYENILKTLLATYDVLDVLQIAARLQLPLIEMNTNIINALLKKDCIEKAIEIANLCLIEDRFMLDTMIMDALAKKGHFERAFTLIHPEYSEREKWMLKLVILVHQYPFHEILTKVSNLPETTEMPCRSMVLANLALSIAGKGEFDQALITLKSIANEEVLHMCSGKLIPFLVTAERYSIMLDLFLNTTLKEKPWPFLNIMLDAKQWDLAEQIAETMDDKAEALMKIRVAQNRIDDAIALALFADQNRDDRLQKLVKYLCENKKFTIAEKVISKINSSPVFAMEVLSKSFLKNKQFEEAIRIAKEIRDTHHQTFSSSQLFKMIAIKWYAEDSSKAEAFINSIEGEQTRASAIAHIFLERGEMEKTLEVFLNFKTQATLMVDAMSKQYASIQIEEPNRALLFQFIPEREDD